MTFELEISTMYKTKEECLQMIQNMNVHCNCMVINQCDIESYEEVILEEQRIRLFFTKERGLSKSRNMALRNCQADILGIADDDLLYYDGFDKIILTYYLSNPNADVAIFNMDSFDHTFFDSDFKCRFNHLGHFISMQVTFKVDKVKTQNIMFNIFLGTGSGFIQSGEENVFLSNCFKRKLGIFYCADKILKREVHESSWFHGFDEKFLHDRGAIYYAISPFLSFFLIFRFAIRKKKLYSPISFGKACKFMFAGRKSYINVLKGK